MKVTPRPVVLSLPPSSTPRSKGVHASGIIRSIAIDMGILQPDGVDESSMADTRTITDPVAIQRICIGLAWEEWYIGTVLTAQGVKKHPGEMCVDGIWMTPDGIQYSLGRMIIIHEVKATYKSINTVGELDPAGNWLWLTQIKGYCKGAGTRYAKLHVLFLCGDYKFPLRPVAKAWEIEFTKKEIDDNWELLRSYKEYKEGDGK